MKVLALQRRRVGDILTATPALRALRARFPQADVTFLCEPSCSPILRSNGDVSTVMGFDSASSLKRHLRLAVTLRQRRFDLVLDFEGSAWTGAVAATSGGTRRIGFRRAALPPAYTDRVTVPDRRGGYDGAEKLLLLEPLGIDVRTVSARPRLETGGRAADWARRTLEAAGIGSGELLVTVAPGARAPEFCWPIQRYARLLDLLAGTHAFAVVLFPWSGDKGLGSELARLTSVPLFQLDVLPSLRQMAALLDRADLHVGNESAAKHIASALGTATVTLYAPGMHRRWGLPGDPLQVGVEPGPSAAPAASNRRGGPPPIARITPEEACAALLGLEAYLPRLADVRRVGPSRPFTAAETLLPPRHDPDGGRPSRVPPPTGGSDHISPEAVGGDPGRLPRSRPNRTAERGR